MVQVGSKNDLLSNSCSTGDIFSAMQKKNENVGAIRVSGHYYQFTKQSLRLANKANFGILYWYGMKLMPRFTPSSNTTETFVLWL
jgi:hypothetical protein